MVRMAILFALLVVSVSGYPLEGISMWGCAPEGERRSVLYLADRGARSYVKLGAQRVPASVHRQDGRRTWSFSTTSIVLDEQEMADYLQDGVLVGRFKCKMME